MDDSSLRLAIKDAVLRVPQLQFLTPIRWEIHAGEQWAVIGANGTGKTILAEVLCGMHALKGGNIYSAFSEKLRESVRLIAFKDIYSLIDVRGGYYQQRWNTSETERCTTAIDLLKPLACQAQIYSLFEALGARDLLEKRILFFSSGELRNFLVIRALLSHPKVLILDNPFIGLDAPSREILSDLLNRLAQSSDLQIILLLSEPEHIPAWITHVQPLKKMQLLPPIAIADSPHWKEHIWALFPASELPILPRRDTPPAATYQETLRMEQIRIRYGERTILNEFDWVVRKGEKWALLGPNGSGKSTLLSLVCADNPQAYANRIFLFDRKRGTGDSIWEVKRRIGYISPEMHLYYLEDVPALKIVASGYFDTVGLYRSCSREQEEGARAWMRLFGIESLAERRFLTLSAGEQRLVLLARTFVKDPDLLILDEPLHGLDIANKKRVSNIIATFCALENKTLIYVTHYPHEIPACVTHRLTLKKLS